MSHWHHFIAHALVGSFIFGWARELFRHFGGVLLVVVPLCLVIFWLRTRGPNRPGRW